MTDAPKIGGRFEFDPSTQTLEIWFTSGRHFILGPEADFDKALRGEVPIKLTGGQATAKSKLTWSEQLSGTIEAEASRLIRGTKVNRYDKRGRLEISLKDLDLGSLLSGMSLPSTEPQDERDSSSSSDSDRPLNSADGEADEAAPPLLQDQVGP